MSKRDYYDILGVQKGANADDIKKAYRKLAMQYHPDRNPGDAKAEVRFKDVSEAYEVLKDDQKKAAYDRFGHEAFTQGHGAGGGGFPGGGDFGEGVSDIIDEMFENFMGGRRSGGGRTSARGSDLRHDLDITLEEAFSGKTMPVSIPTTVSCEPCKGSGARPGTTATMCTACRGQGRIRTQQGMFLMERTCPSCGGQGKVIKEPCSSCRGSGRRHKEKTLEVKIPPGVEDGTRIRLSGEGEAGLRGAAAGDLYIFLTVRPHHIFQRDGANIYCKVPIAMSTAALGGSIEVPVIDGSRAKVNFPSGTQTGNQFRLRGKGMSILRSQARGDMIVQAVVETPVNLTDEQKELLRRFEEMGGSDTSPESAGFFRKMKELWNGLTD